jgi:ribosomal protein L16/L10AE
MSSHTSRISSALMKKLLLIENENQKITNEALEAARFLLTQFILEARNRASIEVSLSLYASLKVFNNIDCTTYFFLF